MGRQQKRSSTKWMIDAVSNADRLECSHLPPEFLCGLRGALEAGLSCEEITAWLVLLTGVYEAGQRMSGPELIERAVCLAGTMGADMRYRAEELEQLRRNKEYLLEKKKRRGR